MRPFRHRKHVRSLQSLIVRVVEFLIDGGNRYLAIDFDLDVVAGHFQRRKVELPRPYQRPYQKWPLHHDKAIPTRIGKYAEQTGCENQERSFHCPVSRQPRGNAPAFFLNPERNWPVQLRWESAAPTSTAAILFSWRRPFTKRTRPGRSWGLDGPILSCR